VATNLAQSHCSIDSEKFETSRGQKMDPRALMERRHRYGLLVFVVRKWS